MNYNWRQTVFPIATIFSFRLLGLFMLIPIFTLYSNQLSHASPILVGIALGSYGLSQGILQIPFGLLSDRYGRKPLIFIGLTLFGIGSLLGAQAHSIELMIVARILQGGGAIGSVLMALLADLTPDHQRTKAMAVVGISIGISFSLAMIISPMIAEYYGLTGIFYLTAILAILGIILLFTVIPTPQRDPFHQQPIINLKHFIQTLKNPHLKRLNCGIFFQHLMLTATFYVLPLMLKQHIQQGHLTESWHFYLPLMLGAFIVMMPILAISERKNRIQFLFIFAVILTTFSQSMLLWFHSWTPMFIASFLYFVAFNLLEATLPSQISKQANASNKGTAMGIYSSSQFLGIFAGGAIAGLLYQQVGTSGVFLFNMVIGCIWFIITLNMKPHHYEFTQTISVHSAIPNEKSLTQKLLCVPGIKEVSICSAEKKIYLHIVNEHYIKGSAEAIIQANGAGAFATDSV